MKQRWNSKKIFIALIVLLIGCDVSLLFAAQANTDNNATQQQLQLQQIEQLRQQLNQRQATAQTPLISSGITLPGAGPIIPSSPNAGSVAASPASAASSAPAAAAQPVSPVVSGTSAPAPVPPPDQSSIAAAQSATPPAASTPAGMVSENDINQAAFEAMAKSSLPMSPEQIQRLRQLFSQTQFAASTWPGIPPRPVISSMSVNLAPGTTPPAVRLQQGMVSVLGFIDSTGAPWPIDSYDIGNPSAFNIQWNRTDNTLLIQPMTLYTYGNLAIKLRGLSTPIILMLFPGQKVFDSRLDLHISGFGPEARPMPMGTGLPNSADPDLLGILDGVPPAGSITLRVTGGECQAWASGERLFVRTRLTILSPGWIATMSSADGMHAYEIPKPAEQAPVLLASANGKLVQLKIEGL